MIPSSMRAIVIEAPGVAALHEVPVPPVRAGEVLVRIEGCGVCGSNLPVWQGRPWFKYPLPPGSPGHEGWGRVAGVGPEVQGWKEGQRVSFLSDRALCEYAVVSPDALCALPSALDEVCFPGEAFGCVMNIFQRTHVRPQQPVAIIGAGFIGAALTALCARAGARVAVISRRPWALALATSLGAERVVELDSDHEHIVRSMNVFSGGDGSPRVIEAVGLQHTLDLATRLCATRGRLVIAGFHQDGPRQVDLQMWNWRGIDVINAHERDPATYLRGMRAAADAAASGVLDVARLVSHRFPLPQARFAFDALAERPDGFLKAVVTP